MPVDQTPVLSGSETYAVVVRLLAQYDLERIEFDFCHGDAVVVDVINEGEDVPKDRREVVIGVPYSSIAQLGQYALGRLRIGSQGLTADPASIVLLMINSEDDEAWSTRHRILCDNLTLSALQRELDLVEFLSRKHAKCEELMWHWRQSMLAVFDHTVCNQLSWDQKEQSKILTQSWLSKSWPIHLHRSTCHTKNYYSWEYRWSLTEDWLNWYHSNQGVIDSMEVQFQMAQEAMHTQEFLAKEPLDICAIDHRYRVCKALMLLKNNGVFEEEFLVASLGHCHIQCRQWSTSIVYWGHRKDLIHDTIEHGMAHLLDMDRKDLTTNHLQAQNCSHWAHEHLEWLDAMSSLHNLG
eukprot:Clim_evm19s143 gene=Clim_evmTU19s143